MNTTENPLERVTPRDWEQIRDAYIRGEGSLRRLAQRQGLPLSTVEARCRRECWVRLRQKRNETGLEKLVGVSPDNVVVKAVEDQDWWAEQDREHLRQNLEVTRRLRQAVDKKINDASATELERLGGALEAIVSAERDLLELAPRTVKNRAPSLRPENQRFSRSHSRPPVEPIG